MGKTQVSRDEYCKLSRISVGREYCKLINIAVWQCIMGIMKGIFFYLGSNSKESVNARHFKSCYEREVGEGMGMGNTCKPMADSFQCMTKSTTNKKNNEMKKKSCYETDVNSRDSTGVTTAGPEDQPLVNGQSAVGLRVIP